MNWSAPRQIRFCACTKMSMNRGDFRSLYQGLLIFHAPCTKKTLGTRLGCLPRIALQKSMRLCSKFFLVTIFPKNVGERGGGEKFFTDIQKKSRKKFSGDKPVKFRVGNFFPYKFLLKLRETLIFGPISVKFRSINYIQFPLEAL